MDVSERHCETIRATDKASSYTASETGCDIPLDEDKYENDDTYNEIETSAAFSSLHVISSDSNMSVNSEEYLIVERNLDKLYVAYLSLKPVEEIASSKIFQINQDQYFAILSGLKMIKDVKSEVKNVSLKSVNEDVKRLSTAEVLINVLNNTVGTNFKNSRDVYLENYLVDEMITLYNCLGRIVRYFYEIIKQTHSNASRHSSIAIAVQKSKTVTQTLSVQTNNHDLDLDLEKLQEEYHDLSTTISLLKSIVEDTPSSVSNIRITQTSNDLVRKMESEYSYTESEKTHKRVTDVTGARKCILECLSELAEVRNYCQNSEMNTAIQVSLKSSEIKCCKTRCCNKDHIPHVHAKLNGIPIVINMRQDIEDTIKFIEELQQRSRKESSSSHKHKKEKVKLYRKSLYGNVSKKRCLNFGIKKHLYKFLAYHKWPEKNVNNFKTARCSKNDIKIYINYIKHVLKRSNRILNVIKQHKFHPLKPLKFGAKFQSYIPLQCSSSKGLHQKLIRLIENLLTPVLPSTPQFFEVRIMADFSDDDMPMGMRQGRRSSNRSKYYDYPGETTTYYAPPRPTIVRGSRRSSVVPHRHGESQMASQPWAPFVTSDTSLPTMADKNKDKDSVGQKSVKIKNPQSNDSGIGPESGTGKTGPGMISPGDMWNPSQCFFCQMQNMSICKTCAQFMMGIQHFPWQCCDAAGGEKQVCRIDATTSCHSGRIPGRSGKTCEIPQKCFADAKTDCVGCPGCTQDKSFGTVPKSMINTTTSYHGAGARLKSDMDDHCLCEEVVLGTSSRKLANSGLHNNCVPSCNEAFVKKTPSKYKVPKNTVKLRSKGSNVSFPDQPNLERKRSKKFSKRDGQLSSSPTSITDAVIQKSSIKTLSNKVIASPPAATPRNVTISPRNSYYTKSQHRKDTLRKACGCGCNTTGCGPHTECMKLLNTRSTLPFFMGPPPVSLVNVPKCGCPPPPSQAACVSNNILHHCHFFTYMLNYPPSSLQPARDQNDVSATVMKEFTNDRNMGNYKKLVPSWRTEERSPQYLRSVLSLLQLVKYFADSFIETSKHSIISQNTIVAAYSEINEGDIRSTSYPDLSKVTARRDNPNINFSRNYSFIVKGEEPKKKKYTFGNTSLSTEKFRKSTWASKWKSTPCITVSNRVVDFKVLDFFLKFISQETSNFEKGKQILQGDSQKEICFIQTPKEYLDDESDSNEEDEESVEELRNIPQRSGMLTMTHNPAFHVNFDNSFASIACSRNLEDIILDFSADDAF